MLSKKHLPTPLPIEYIMQARPRPQRNASASRSYKSLKTAQFVTPWKIKTIVNQYKSPIVSFIYIWLYKITPVYGQSHSLEATERARKTIKEYAWGASGDLRQKQHVLWKQTCIADANLNPYCRPSIIIYRYVLAQFLKVFILYLILDMLIFLLTIYLAVFIFISFFCRFYLLLFIIYLFIQMCPFINVWWPFTYHNTTQSRG